MAEWTEQHAMELDGAACGGVPESGVNGAWRPVGGGGGKQVGGGVQGRWARAWPLGATRRRRRLNGEEAN